MQFEIKNKYSAETQVVSEIDCNEKNLPTFRDMYGMAPNATGGIPAEDFIANLRERKDNGTND